MFKANSKYQTPERCQVDNKDDFQVNFRTYFSSRSSAFNGNFKQVIAGYNNSVFN